MPGGIFRICFRKARRGCHMTFPRFSKYYLRIPKAPIQRSPIWPPLRLHVSTCQYDASPRLQEQPSRSREDATTSDSRMCFPGAPISTLQPIPMEGTVGKQQLIIPTTKCQRRVVLGRTLQIAQDEEECFKGITPNSGIRPQNCKPVQPKAGFCGPMVLKGSECGYVSSDKI